MRAQISDDQMIGLQLYIIPLQLRHWHCSLGTLRPAGLSTWQTSVLWRGKCERFESCANHCSSTRSFQSERKRRREELSRNVTTRYAHIHLVANGSLMGDLFEHVRLSLYRRPLFAGQQSFNTNSPTPSSPFETIPTAMNGYSTGI
jgi:hypothetical protein